MKEETKSTLGCLGVAIIVGLLMWFCGPCIGMGRMSIDDANEASHLDKSAR